MKFESKFKPGDFVYLRTGDDTESSWMVTAVRFSLGGSVVYICNCGTKQGEFYAQELDSSPDYSLKGARA